MWKLLCFRTWLSFSSWLTFFQWVSTALDRFLVLPIELRVYPAFSCSTTCLHMPVNGLGWLSQSTHLSPLSHPESKYYNSNHTFWGNEALFQEGWHSKMHLGFLHVLMFILLVLQDTSGWTMASRLTPFIMLPQNHTQILAILNCHLSSLPERKLHNTEETASIFLPAVPWRVSGT